MQGRIPVVVVMGRTGQPADHTWWHFNFLQVYRRTARTLAGAGAACAACTGRRPKRRPRPKGLGSPSRGSRTVVAQVVESQASVCFAATYMLGHHTHDPSTHSQKPPTDLARRGALPREGRGRRVQLRHQGHALPVARLGPAVRVVHRVGRTRGRTAAGECWCCCCRRLRIKRRSIDAIDRRQTAGLAIARAHGLYTCCCLCVELVGSVRHGSRASWGSTRMSQHARTHTQDTALRRRPLLGVEAARVERASSPCEVHTPQIPSSPRQFTPGPADHNPH